MKFFKLLPVFLFLFSPLAMAKNQIFYYQPKSVELTGIIKILTFPGPPNYESVKKGDLREKGIYLILKNPVDIELVPNTEQMSNDELEKNVKIIQLVVYRDVGWGKFKKDRDNEYAHVKGTLFRAYAGHHHARVLLRIEEIDFLPRKKMLAADLTITEKDCFYMADPDQEPKLTLRISNGQICSGPFEPE